MKTIYLDCFAGIAGDMFIGALLNLVPSPDVLINGLKKLALPEDEYELVIEKAVKNSIAGINFDVKLKHGHEHNHEEHEHEHTHSHEHHHEHGHEHEHTHEHRNLADIEKIIASSELNLRVKQEALKAFNILASAEANVHGTTPDKIHFHEVGAVDSIIDIVGSLILVDFLGWPRFLSSPVNVGSGTVKCAHGILPVPAPATEFLLHGIPIFSNGEPMERTTPTGALLIKILADGFGNMPTGKILASGYGLGNKTTEDIPNVLRAVLLENEVDNSDKNFVHEKLALLECNIDDMNPQDYEPLIEKLFASGALDVWLENIAMKKFRPGVKFCCLAKPEDTKKFCGLILLNTTSQGVRIHELDRLRLNWEIEKFNSSLGEVRVKNAFYDEKILRRTPEFDDLKALSQKHNIPINAVRKILSKEL